MKYFTLSSFLLFMGISVLAQTPEAELLGQWSDPAIPGSNAYDNAYNEIWGISVNGHEFAVLGSSLGTHFIDVTDPSQPQEMFFVSGAFSGSGVIHRDYHDYAGYLYAVCDEGPSTLQIMDIRNLPDTVTVVYDSNNALRRAHNIFIDTTSARLYALAVSTPNTYSALRIYDLSDPLDPQFVAAYNSFGDVQAGHVHDAYVRQDTAFLNCGYDGFAVVDFSDPLDPVTLGTLTDYPAKGYNHSGWLNEDGSTYYMADENHASPMKILDITALPEIPVLGTFDAAVSNPNSIPHNQLVMGYHLYVAYYYEGLVVYDISDPAAPEKILSYDTSVEPSGKSYKGAWGVYPYLPSGNILVSDMQEGLFVFAPVAGTTAVESPESGPPALRVFPNPAYDHLQVITTDGLPGQARLFSAAGQLVGSWVLNGTQRQTLSLPATLPSGLYLLQVNSGTDRHQQLIQVLHAD